MVLKSALLNQVRRFVFRFVPMPTIFLSAKRLARRHCLVRVLYKIVHQVRPMNLAQLTLV